MFSESIGSAVCRCLKATSALVSNEYIACRLWYFGDRWRWQPLPSQAQAATAPQRVSSSTSVVLALQVDIDFELDRCEHTCAVCRSSFWTQECSMHTSGKIVLPEIHDSRSVGLCIASVRAPHGYSVVLEQSDICMSCQVVLLVCRGSIIRVIPCSAVPDDAYVVDASYMGAPTVSIEKLDSSQAEAAARAVLKVGHAFPLLPCRTLS